MRHFISLLDYSNEIVPELSGEGIPAAQPEFDYGGFS